MTLLMGNIHAFDNDDDHLNCSVDCMSFACFVSFRSICRLHVLFFNAINAPHTMQSTYSGGYDHHKMTFIYICDVLHMRFTCFVFREAIDYLKTCKQHTLLNKTKYANNIRYWQCAVPPYWVK